MGMIDRSSRRIPTSGRLANAGVTHELGLLIRLGLHVEAWWGSPQVSAKLFCLDGLGERHWRDDHGWSGREGSQEPGCSSVASV